MAAGEGVLVDVPDHVIEVYMGGDALLIVNNMCGFKGRCGIKVCTTQLCMTSTVFLTLLTDPDVAHVRAAPEQLMDHIRVLELPDDDGDALLLLLYLVHFEHDKLPPCLPVELLYGVASLTAKYLCEGAIARTTWPWFDAFAGTVNAGKSTSAEIFTAVQAAFLLDEPTIFRRMTDLWVSEHPRNLGFHVVSDRPVITRLARELKARQIEVVHHLRQDFDRIVDPCTLPFSASSRHLVDHEPGARPDEGLDGTTFSEVCNVDIRAASVFLGSLRDERIFPALVWHKKVGATIRAFARYRVPDFDDNDKCGYCKLVKDAFTHEVAMVQKTHAGGRCWGLCLDCFRKGKDSDGAGDQTCRVKHCGVTWNEIVYHSHQF